MLAVQKVGEGASPPARAHPAGWRQSSEKPCSRCGGNVCETEENAAESLWRARTSSAALLTSSLTPVPGHKSRERASRRPRRVMSRLSTACTALEPNWRLPCTKQAREPVISNRTPKHHACMRWRAALFGWWRRRRQPSRRFQSLCVRQPSSCASHPPTPLLPTALGVVVAQRVPKAEHAAGWRGVRLRGTGANAAGGMRGGVRERSEKKVGAGSTRRGEHKHTQQGRPGRLGGPGSRHAGVQEPPPQKRSP